MDSAYEICIALLICDVVGPSLLVLAQNLVDGGFFRFCIVIHTREVIEVIFLLAVLALATRESELGIRLDLVRFRDLLRAICKVSISMPEKIES